LDQSADPNIQDYNGKTSLHIVSELNSREHVASFINHCKMPIDWSLEDNTGNRAVDVPNSREIKRLLTTYMKTSTAHRHGRDHVVHKPRRRGMVSNSKSKSRTKESGSVSKRVFKSSKFKSPQKSPFNATKYQRIK
jgi:hypothetical protein